MERQFLAVLERERPGADEHVIGMVFVHAGATIWLDLDGDRPYPQIPPNEDAFQDLQSLANLGDRRLLAVPAEHFDEIKGALRRSVRSPEPAIA